MLLNEFLKEHREVAELKTTDAEQRKGMEAMATQLAARTPAASALGANTEGSFNTATFQLVFGTAE
jgi:hypothetical protein